MKNLERKNKIKYWPVPNSYSKKIPIRERPGSFWKNRDDRYHCGIDIYSSEGSDVISIEKGKVIETGTFTSSNENPYWNTTFYILIKNKSGFVCKYAELGDIKVKRNELIKVGQLIGHVGLVLNSKRITKESPMYIQKLIKNKNNSMLHFELYSSQPDKSDRYFGGNWFGDLKPKNLLDPSNYLINTEKNI